ncbi:MAG: hypothetical protein RR135_03030 [Oscillospiraceae bacterium]
MMDHRRTIRRFCTAFFVTLILWTTFCGFAAVDRVAMQGGFGTGYNNAFLLLKHKDAMTYAVETSWREFEIDLTPVEAFETIRRPLETFLTPRALRLAARWTTAMHLWLEQWRNARREQDYRRNAGLI